MVLRSTQPFSKFFRLGAISGNLGVKRVKYIEAFIEIHIFSTLFFIHSSTCKENLLKNQDILQVSVVVISLEEFVLRKPQTGTG